MAVDLTKLIDLSLLQRYDTNLKAWVEKRVTESHQIIFTTENSLPATGNMNLVYVTEDSIFLWDGSKYIKVGGQGTGTTFIPSIDKNGDLTWTNDGGLTNPNPVNVRGPAGQDGADGKSAYDIAVENGFTGDEDEWLESLKGSDGVIGKDGQSAYELAVDNGYTGSETDWLESLKGKDGANGASFTIKGLYPTYDDLITAHPTGEAGDAYAIGDSDYNEIYNWSVDKQEWENLGSLEGPQGPKGEDSTVPGPKGDDGVSPTVTITETDSGVDIEIIDADGTQKFSLTNGIAGTDGQSAFELAVEAGFEGELNDWLESLKGKDGVDGEDGKSAYELAVAAGYEGDEESWLESLKADAVQSLSVNKDGYIVATMGDGTETTTDILSGTEKSVITLTIDDNNNLSVTYRDGTEEIIGQLAKEVEITDIQLNDENQLEFTMSDGSILVTDKAIEGKQGKDGANVVAMRLDENRHLISTLSNGIEIDAGEIDIEGLTIEETRVIDVAWTTSSITFDGATTQFSLPVASKTLMVFVNGLCLEKNLDYTIDEDNATIAFSEIFNTTDKCTLRWLDENANDSDMWATREDINKLFADDIDSEGQSLWATPADIDKLF